MRLALILALLGSTACIPFRVSSRCRQEASDCMAQCPAPIEGAHDPLITTRYDRRSNCEVECADRARSCEFSDK
jgi:hypothetical protein